MDEESGWGRACGPWEALSRLWDLGRLLWGLAWELMLEALWPRR